MSSDQDVPTPDLKATGEAYPSWARTLARRYLSKTLSQFILHGNIRDLVPARTPDGEPTYLPLRKYLSDEVFAARDYVIFYDRSSGIHFADADSRKDFRQALSGYDAMRGTSTGRRLPTDPAEVFPLLENYFRLRLSDGKRVACVIDFAETIVPMSEASMYSGEDRRSLVFLQKWAHDSDFLKRDFTICLLTENLSDLNQQLVQSPHTSEIRVPIPGVPERLRFINWFLADSTETFNKLSDVSSEALAQNTAGLNYTQLRTILGDVVENQTPLTFNVLSDLKKDFIEAEAYGLLEFVETDHDLDMVAGHAEAKKHLRQAARALQNGRPEVLPMGYLVSGPVGTGKTFLITCFAGEIGIPMVKLKNFRSQWQGVTEGNLEKILNLLEAMTPVAVMIDEADAALGNRSATGDSGVSQRVFAQIANFMSRPANRGRVIFFLVTARPDLMPVDLKRQGRAEEHLALFYPSTRKERKELLEVVMRRTGVDIPEEDIPEVLLNGEKKLSGADMEALLTRASFQSAATGKDQADAKTLKRVIDDFIPPTYPLEIELQTLAAVLECTSRSMLPKRYKKADRKEIIQRIEELKRLVQ